MMDEQDAGARLAEILNQLSINQKRYLIARVDCNTDAEAAKRLGIKVSTVYEWRGRNAAPVDEALSLMMNDGIITAKNLLAKAVAKAALTKVDALDSPDEKLRQAAATEIMDRQLGKPRVDVDVTGNVTATVNFDDAIKKIYGDDG